MFFVFWNFGRHSIFLHHCFRHYTITKNSRRLIELKGYCLIVFSWNCSERWKCATMMKILLFGLSKSQKPCCMSIDAIEAESRFISLSLSLESMRYWGEAKALFTCLAHSISQSKVMQNPVFEWEMIQMIWTKKGSGQGIYRKNTYLLFLGVSQKRTLKWDSCGARSLGTPFSVSRN